jgi:hypothetical protein
MEISIKGVLNANKYELSKLAFSLNQRAVQEAFAKVGILIENENDLKILARLHEEGGDVAGKFKDYSGKPIYFDFEEVLANTEMNDGDQEKIKQLNLIW